LSQKQEKSASTYNISAFSENGGAKLDHGSAAILVVRAA